MVLFYGGANAAETSRSEELMQERVVVLEALVKVVEMQFEEATVSSRQVLEAMNELVAAKLAVARDQEARVALRKEMLTNLVALEKVVKAQSEAGLGGPEDALRAQAARLKAEAMLLRESGN